MSLVDLINHVQSLEGRFSFFEATPKLYNNKVDFAYDIIEKMAREGGGSVLLYDSYFIIRVNDEESEPHPYGPSKVSLIDALETIAELDQTVQRFLQIKQLDDHKEFQIG